MKRYMVFAWDIYDNASPFDRIEGSFEELQEAEDCAKGCVHCQFTAIFDRVGGFMFPEVLRGSDEHRS